MASDQTAPVPAGWYPDPYGASEMRWWDGQNWTDSIHPPAAPEAAAPPEFAPPQPDSLLSLSDGTANSAPVSVPEEQPAQALPTHEQPLQETTTQAPTVAEPAVAEPAVADPAVADPAVAEPARAEPALAEPTDVDPAVEAPSAEGPAPAPGSDRLPSRREMRLRKELESAESGSSVTAFSHDTPPPLTEPPALSVPTPKPTAELADSAPPVPDSSAPTAFDWLPGANTSGLNSPPAAPSKTPVTPPASSSPIPQTLGGLPSGEPAQSSSFPPLGTPVSATPMSGPPGEFAGAQTGISNPWAQDPGMNAVNDNSARSTATRKATVSSWFIAAMPLLAGILSITAVKGQENYPNYVPAGIEWWMLVAGVLVLLYLVTLILAVADRKKLDWAGYYSPAHWAWALLTAPVYLLARTISVKRETGRTSLLLVVWLILVAVLVGAWFAADSFAPELISGYTLPFL